MSAKLTFTNGRYEIAYRGTKPWHGEGQVINAGDSIETIQEKAGLTWKIQRSKVRYAIDREAASLLEMPEQHVLFRSDTKAPLSVVSERYQVVQPAEILEFFRDLIDKAGFELETAGSLKGGRILWAMARTGDPMHILGNDLIKPYVMLATACDGSMATVARNVTERVVCNNTLDIAMSEKGNKRVAISHRSIFDADKVKSLLGAVPTQFAEFTYRMRELARKPMSLALAENFTSTLLEETSDEKHSVGWTKIMSLFAGEARGSHMADDSYWQWLNAVTEYADHYARARSDTGRVLSAQFGPGNDLKGRALELVTQ